LHSEQLRYVFQRQIFHGSNPPYNA
jgi:hypothetical protein